MPPVEVVSDPILPSWSTRRIIVSVVLFAGAYLVAQVGGVVCAFLVEQVANPELDVDAWGAGAETNGLVFSLATISGAILGVPVLRLIVARVEPRPWAFLGFEPAPLRTYLAYGIALLALIGAVDALTWALGRPIVPSFMIAVYSSSSSKVLLFLTLTLAAPLIEELAIRGFLLSALRARGVPVVWCAVLTSLFWSLLHTQYGLYVIATIFFLGLFLAYARLQSGSILLPLAMHALANAIAFIETALAVGEVAT